MPKNHDSGPNAYHRVWEFRNKSATWIVWKIGHDPPVPTVGSALAAWGTLAVCYDLAPGTMFTRPAATAVARLLRSIRRGEGLTILHDRQFGRPPGHPRPVTIDGVNYRSEKQAAAVLGISRTLVRRLSGR